MGRLIIVEPMSITAVVASRGTGADNLKTADPKEVWADTTVNSAATFQIDLGLVRSIDTILLGFATPLAAGTTWAITTGVAGSAESVAQAETAARAPDVAGHAPAQSHALWRGAARDARYLAVSITQPAGVPPLTVGVLAIGKAFVAELGQEWGFGRRPIDTGTATPLPSGGFAVVEGARKRFLSWTFGDLSIAEADQLELLALALGETKPGLVVEDDDQTTGLRARIHWGLFDRWRQFERRNRKQTRWEVGLEEWI